MKTNKRKPDIRDMFKIDLFRSSTFDDIKAKFKIQHEALGDLIPYENNGKSMTAEEIFNNLNNTSLKVRSSVDGNYLTIDGSYIKWLTGQNVVGTADLIYLCLLTFQRVCAEIGLTPTQQELAAIKQGAFRLLRVDFAVHCDAGSEDAAIFLQRQIKKHWAFDRPFYSHYNNYETLYVSQHSKRRIFKAYMKGRDIKAKGGLPGVAFGKEIEIISNRLIRLEMTWRNKALKEIKSATHPELYLRDPLAWKGKNAKILMKRRIKELLSGITGESPANKNYKGHLSNADKVVIAAHNAGVDIARIYDKRAFKRIKEKIIKRAGIDIDMPVGQHTVGPDYVAAQNLIRKCIRYRSKRALFNYMVDYANASDDDNETSSISNLMG